MLIRMRLIMPRFPIGVLALVLLPWLAACSSNPQDNVYGGAGVGAATGAGIGLAFGGIGAIPGALIGAGLGAGGGAVSDVQPADDDAGAAN